MHWRQLYFCSWSQPAARVPEYFVRSDSRADLLMNGSCWIANSPHSDTRGAAPQLDDAPASATAVGTSPRRTLFFKSLSSAQDNGVGNFGTNSYFLAGGGGGVGVGVVAGREASTAWRASTVAALTTISSARAAILMLLFLSFLFFIFRSHFFGVLLVFFCTSTWQGGEASGGEIVVCIGCNVARLILS